MSVVQIVRTPIGYCRVWQQLKKYNLFSVILCAGFVAGCEPAPVDEIDIPQQEEQTRYTADTTPRVSEQTNTPNTHEVEKIEEKDVATIEKPQEYEKPVVRNGDLVEITPEATQAAKNWNAHITALKGELAVEEPVKASIDSLLSSL